MLEAARALAAMREENLLSTSERASASGYAMYATAPRGPHAGQWVFFQRQSFAAPEAAYHLRFANSAPYTVQAAIYCDDGGCAVVHAALAKLAPPVPTRRDLAAWNAWFAMAAAQPCAPGAAHMPLPSYPVQGYRVEASGRVEVKAAFDRCGRVLDTWLGASSGNRDLDRAALRKVREWRLPTNAAQAGVETIKITFAHPGPYVGD